MSRIIFILVLSLANLIRGPLSVILIVFKNFHPLLKKRIDFERKNLMEASSRSFKKDLLVADYCFEVSSEGELEQVRPLMEYFLLKKAKIEILFSSPSVEDKCQKLAAAYPDLIRILRLPLLSFFPLDFLFFQSPWSFVTAPVIIFCRYDFFPELLSFKWLGKKMILVSAATKKPSWFKEQAYSFFSVIVAANNHEERLFKSMFPDKVIFAFDFRVPRIFERISRAPDVLIGTKSITHYLIFLKERDKSQNIIMGSAWPSDLVLLQNGDKTIIEALKDGSLHLCIVPHSLSEKSIEDITEVLKTVLPDIPVTKITNNNGDQNFAGPCPPGIVLLCISGILCELYTQFSFAYVGGGFERSIHSVLEPYLSGAIVACGPQVHRSTEYDFIKDLSPNEIHLLKNAESFYNLLKELKTQKSGTVTSREHLLANAKAQMETIVHEIQSC